MTSQDLRKWSNVGDVELESDLLLAAEILFENGYPIRFSAIPLLPASAEFILMETLTTSNGSADLELMHAILVENGFPVSILTPQNECHAQGPNSLPYCLFLALNAHDDLALHDLAQRHGAAHGIAPVLINLRSPTFCSSPSSLLLETRLETA